MWAKYFKYESLDFGSWIVFKVPSSAVSVLYRSYTSRDSLKPRPGNQKIKISFIQNIYYKYSCKLYIRLWLLNNHVIQIEPLLDFKLNYVIIEKRFNLDFKLCDNHMKIENEVYPYLWITFKWSNVCKENVVSPFIPLVLLPVVIGSWSWNLLSSHFLVEPGLFVLESSRWFEILPFLLFIVLLLYLLNNIIILKVLLFNFIRHLLESFLSHAKPWLFDDKIWILLFLFDDFSSNVIIN